MLKFIRHHFSSCISNSSYYMSNACMNYKIEGRYPWYISSMCICYPTQIPRICTSSGGVLSILQSNSSNSVLTFHIIIPIENLIYLSSTRKKGEKSESYSSSGIHYGLIKFIKLQTLGSSEVFDVMCCNLRPMVFWLFQTFFPCMLIPQVC